MVSILIAINCNVILASGFNSLDSKTRQMMGKRCSRVWPLLQDGSQYDLDLVKKQKKKKAKKKIGQMALTYLSQITVEQREAIEGMIFVSNADAARDAYLLSALEVSAVISVGGGKKSHNNDFVDDFKHIGIKDRSETSYLPIFEEAVSFAAPIIESGRNLLVHCQGGMHRSPVVAAALLVRFAGLSAEQAIASIQAARPIADFSSHNNHLKKELVLYEAKLKSEFANDKDLIP